MKKDDPLDSLLETWIPKARVPEGFQDEVWRRIASAEAPSLIRWPVMVIGWRAALMSAAAVAVAGFFLGNLMETKAGAADRDAYFARINPLAQGR